MLVERLQFCESMGFRLLYMRINAIILVKAFYGVVLQESTNQDLLKTLFVYTIKEQKALCVNLLVISDIFTTMLYVVSI